MFWPISIIIAGMILVAMFLFAPDTTSQNPPATVFSTGIFAYPNEDDDQDSDTGANNNPYPDEDATSTPTADRTASPTPTESEDEEDETDSAGRNATSTPRSSSSQTETPADDDEPTASPFPTATDDTEDATDSVPDFGPAIATETSTPTSTPEPDTLECPAEAVTEITGQGPPNTPLVLFFGNRPVGGGTTNSEGFYSIPLKIVHERTNETYEVEVRIRDNHKVIRTVTCIVPGPTPVP
jgi:hypothetical protein